MHHSIARSTCRTRTALHALYFSTLSRASLHAPGHARHAGSVRDAPGAANDGLNEKSRAAEREKAFPSRSSQPLAIPLHSFVEFQSFDGSTKVGIVIAVDDQGTLHAHLGESSAAYPTRVKAAFVRFATVISLPADIVLPGGGGYCSASISRELEAFKRSAKAILHANFDRFEVQVEQEHMKRQGRAPLGQRALIYEGDLAARLFLHDCTAAHLYATHLYLYSYSSKFGKDPAFSPSLTLLTKESLLGPTEARPFKVTRAACDGGSGPYFVRSQQDTLQIRLAERLLTEEPQLATRFKDALAKAVGGGPHQFLGEEAYAPFAYCIRKALLAPFADRHGSPFVKVAQQLSPTFDQGASTPSPHPAAALFITDEEMASLDIVKAQSGIPYGALDTARPASEAPSQAKAGSSTRSHPALVMRVQDASVGRTLFDTCAFAIDSTGTVEVDDAISTSTIGGRTWLHIHVADPTRYIAPGSPTDRHAQEMAASAYFTQQSYAMLPHGAASEASLSSERPLNFTMTLSALLSQDGRGDIEDYNVSLGVVPTLLHLTREAVDQAIAQDGSPATQASGNNSKRTILSAALALAREHNAFRSRNGKADLDVPRGRVYLENSRGAASAPCSDGNGHVGPVNGPPTRLKFVLQTSATEGRPSDLLVSECMIIAGRVAALYAAQRKIPIPYRWHESPVATAADSTSAHAIADLLRRISERSRRAESNPHEADAIFDKLCLLSHVRPSAVALTPRPHWAMGLESYCRATSPLRRYFDLLLHYQLSSVLKSARPAMDASHLTGLIPRLYRHEQYLKALMSRSDRFWIFQHLHALLRASPQGGNKQGPPALPIDCIPLEYDAAGRTTKAYLIEYGIVLYSTIAGGSTLPLGQRCKLHLLEVNLFKQTLHLAIP